MLCTQLKLELDQLLRFDSAVERDSAIERG
jgi:hypothetical protein